jgi:hypothetical protein
VRVGLEMRSLRMRLFTVKYLGDCLTLVRSKSSNVDQPSHVLAGRRCNHGAGVGVPSKQNRSVGSLDNAIKCSGVV